MGTIYVLCPPNIKTGGTELAHQLVYELNSNGMMAEIAYSKSSCDSYLHPAFSIYVKTYSVIDDVVDANDNTVVIPEGMTRYAALFKQAKVFVWWMSVDNYFYPQKLSTVFRNSGFKPVLKEILRRLIRYDYKNSKSLPIKQMSFVQKHLVQSAYAFDFLVKNGVPKDKITFLSDYINDEYIELANHVDPSRKENIVLYNPKKGIRFTKKIISHNSAISFVPIINMTNSDVMDAMMKAKVYIDFGNHPGKDRIPREAALLLCCVITGKRGSANFFEDVPIAPEFKFEETGKNIKRIGEEIAKIFNEYELYLDKYANYRLMIKAEKKAFKEQVRFIFQEK